MTCMATEREDRPSYRQAVFSGLPWEDETPRLEPEEERELEQRLREIAEARAEAAVHSRDYLIH